MSRYQSEVKSRLQTSDAERGGRGGALSHCPHCGHSLAWEPEPARIRWYIAEDARTPAAVSTLGAKLLDSLRANGQAVYVSPDGGKTMRRVGIATAANGERIPAEDREPIILTPEEFQQYWRQAGRATRAAGGAR